MAAGPVAETHTNRLAPGIVVLVAVDAVDARTHAEASTANSAAARRIDALRAASPQQRPSCADAQRFVAVE